MRLALTGATGNLGRLVIDELLDGGTPASQVIAIVRDPGRATALTERGIEVRRADYSQPEALRTALDGVDRLLLISISTGDASRSHGTVIDAAKAAGVGHVAYTSILNADSSTNPLAREHAATERLLAASGMPSTVLRNAWYHELYTRLMAQYLATGEVVGSTGKGLISGAARADFAAAAAHVLACDDTESRTYELGGTAFDFEELARTIAEVSGRPVSHRDLTDEEYVAELTEQGMDEGTARFLVSSDTSIRHGWMHTDSDALARLVGRPLIPLADSVRAAL